MTQIVAPSTSYEATLEAGVTGLVGTLELGVYDGDTATEALSTAGINEIGTSGVYVATRTAPAAGQYVLLWTLDGTLDPDQVITEDLLVTSTSPAVIPVVGTGTVWITGDDVADCCNVETSSGVIFDAVAEQASDLLFSLSGRLFAGLQGPRTVRPPCDSCYCGYQILSRGHIVGPQAIGYPLDSLCGSCLTACDPSMVKLAGYPIREVSEVKVGGDVLAADEYFLHNDRYLVRANSVRWPISQNLTLPDTEDHTWSVTYTYGADPPALAIAAAAQLGCELYKACSSGSGDCILPTGVTRITRQGLTIDRLAFTSWSYREGRWATGLSLVDAFLAGSNPAGLQRRPVLWAPGRRQYSQPWAP